MRHLIDAKHRRLLTLGTATMLCWTIGCGDSQPAQTPVSVAPPAPNSQKQAVTGTLGLREPEQHSQQPSVDDGSRSEPPIIQEASAHQSAKPPTAKRWRMADDRPSINEARLVANGIQRYDGQRLVLLSDLPADQVQHLPTVADQLFARLEAYFGPLPDALDGSAFQVTGHLIENEQRFQAAGLLPSETFTFEHGRHLNYQFWVYNQKQDYYRRHLLLHEFTHCFMTCESGMQNIPPLWYIEGMAEYFATHRLPADSTDHNSAQFGVMPNSVTGFEGWGRIAAIQKAIHRSQNAWPAAANVSSLADATPDTVTSFGDNLQYAESWAFCWMIHHHPAFQEQFSRLTTIRTRKAFIEAFKSLISDIQPHLATEWLLFQESVEEGFDPVASFNLNWQSKPAIATTTDNRPLEVKFHAERGWQSTNLQILAGQEVHISCRGRVQLNDNNRPWVSEPQGISIEYHHGYPLGQVLAVLIDAQHERLLGPVAVGRSTTLTAPTDGTLWLQINDHSGARSDNSGMFEATISVSAGSPQ